MMKRKNHHSISLLVCLCILVCVVNAQKIKSNTIVSNPSSIHTPKLVVGLVIDQMRWDFLHRYEARYGEDGFKKLLSEGFSCDNTMITHLPTYTAVGHAGIYTGAFPSVHGIVGNDWYDYQTGQLVYCTADSTAHAIGGSVAAGKMSPRNLLTTTITDELRLSTNFKSKIIGISMKDRGAILPAGQSGNAAYWYDDSTGTMMSSDYYMKSLPDWVDKFNDLNRPENYLKDGWKPLRPIADYDMSTIDDMYYEAGMLGSKAHTFPYTFNLDSANKYKLFRMTPTSMQYSFDFAKRAMEAENLGKGNVTDFLALSISATDYIGHAYGPNSMETEDAYLRLDQYIADFITYLNKSIGKGQYLLFLTADHGVAHNPSFLREHNIQADVLNGKLLVKTLNDSIESRFKIKNAIGSLQNYQLYYSPLFLKEHKFSMPLITDFLITYLEQQTGISRVYSIADLEKTTMPEKQRVSISLSWHKKRSGQLQIIPEPGYFDGSMKGTTHGAWNPYDAHIPLLWYGWHVPKGSTYEEVHMTDIAPTLAAMLRIQMPNGTEGRVVEKLLISPK